MKELCQLVVTADELREQLAGVRLHLGRRVRSRWWIPASAVPLAWVFVWMAVVDWQVWREGGAWWNLLFVALMLFNAAVHMRLAFLEMYLWAQDLALLYVGKRILRENGKST